MAISALKGADLHHSCHTSPFCRDPESTTVKDTPLSTKSPTSVRSPQLNMEKLLMDVQSGHSVSPSRIHPTQDALVGVHAFAPQIPSTV